MTGMVLSASPGVDCSPSSPSLKAGMPSHTHDFLSSIDPLGHLDVGSGSRRTFLLVIVALSQCDFFVAANADIILFSKQPDVSANPFDRF
jgi:hypothetical protein